MRERLHPRCGSARASAYSSSITERSRAGNAAGALAEGQRALLRPRRVRGTHLVLRASDLDKYEGRASPEFAKQYLNPDQKQTDASDMEYEHPADLERPQFHPMPAHGFVSDPCGPLYDPKYERYHLFFQNVPDSTEWKFGITWGHITSTDLVHWEHLPPALEPGRVSADNDSFFRWDADGCFTGCATMDPDGKPTILYTGVRLRNNEAAGPFPPEEDDTDMPFVEAQLCAAQSDPDDEYHRVWTKLETEALAEAPPAELRPARHHTGWRDPFLVEHPTEANGMMYTMLIGNGSSKTGGRVLVYRSKHLTSGWKYTGTLCGAKNGDNGCLWEYPVLAWLPEAAAAEDGSVAFEARTGDASADSRERSHVMLTGPDAPVNPCIYWVGSYDGDNQKFDLESALGPFRLDMGEILYAVNSLVDAKGRRILFGWLQEGERDDHGYSYSGCESLPRELLLRGDRIVQRPIPEIDLLRGEKIWTQESNREVREGELLALPGEAGNGLDILVSFERGEATQSGLMFGSWAAGGRGSCALLYNWDTNYLEAIFDTFFICNKTKEIRDHPFGEPRGELEERRVGGPVEPRPEGGRIQLRVLLDGSVLEVFTSTGAALATRVYRAQLYNVPPHMSRANAVPHFRGMRPVDTCCDIGFMSVGGSSTITEGHCWNMESCWTDTQSWREGGQQACSRGDTIPASKLTRDTKYGESQVGRCKACSGLHREGECPVFKDGHHPD